jgi:hypothetical protein
MKLTTADELLIQRCVDDELGPAETAALLRRLEELDLGWKSLACGLLEDRSLRRILSGEAIEDLKLSAGVDGTADESSGQRSVLAVRPPENFRQMTRRWWSHPVTSLTLCAAIFFVGGMLLQDQLWSDAGAARLTMSTTGNSGTALPVGAWKFQLPGQRPVDVPVYQRAGDLMRMDRNHPLFDSDQKQRAVRWLIVPAGDGKSMLVPVTEEPVPQIQ